MKTIKIENGEIRKGYELNDLSKDVFNKVITDQINFEVEGMNENSPYYYLAEEMEKMQTPWFLGEAIYDNHFASICETIKINGYLFDEDGDLLPVTYHTKNSKIYKTTYGKKEYNCIIE